MKRTQTRWSADHDRNRRSPLARVCGVPDEFMTVAEVAETLRLNQQTIRNWIDAGILPAVRLGRRVRVKRSDFDRLVEEGYSGPSSSASSSSGVWEGEIRMPELP